MRHTRWFAAALIGIGSIGAVKAAPETQPAVWQERHAQFDYFGVTSLYTCDSIEVKVRQILVYLGARPDVQVNATGCPRGPDSLSRSAWVRVDFSTLVAAPANDASAQVTAASWTPLELAAQRPGFMGDGDCELIDKMRKLVTDNFSWRGNVAYRTSCPPNTTQFYDYKVQGEVLKLTPVPSRRSN